MLQQILKDMYIEPELLAELDEEQKQLLFCKMREEQVRIWNFNELESEKDEKFNAKKRKEGGKKVSFKVGLDGEPMVAVIGFGSDSDEDETLLEEKAERQAELEADDLRVAAEEELDKLVNQSRSTVLQMETGSTTEKRDPTREAVVKSLQEAKLELEEKMRTETKNSLESDKLNTIQKSEKTQIEESAKFSVNVPKSHINSQKTPITLEPYNFKGNSQTSDKNVPLTHPKVITASNSQQEAEYNREKLKDVPEIESNREKLKAAEDKTPSLPLYLASSSSAYSSSGSASMVTIRSMVANQISDFPRTEPCYQQSLGVAAQVKEFERLSSSSLEALKTATLERAKKRRQREILDHLRHLADMAKITDPEEVAWREQERRAKNAEKRIREIARRAREQHRQVASGSEVTLSGNSSFNKGNVPNKSRHSEDINGNTNVNLESSTNINMQRVEAKKTVPIKSGDVKTEILTKPAKPPSRQAIIEWFRVQELPKGSGLDPMRQQVAEWFHGIISRNEAEDILLNNEVGSFLVRVSERIWGYVVSYRSSERCRHYLIDITDGNYAFLGSYKNTHSSLYDLITYHKTNAVTTSGDESELLLKPCGRKSSKIVYEELFSGTTYKMIQN